MTLGAEAVGLLRTELLFIERASAPSVAEQTAAYQAVIDALEGGAPSSARSTLVLTSPCLTLPCPTRNPALGLRGIRLCLAREELLAEQLRAILTVRRWRRCASCCRWSARSPRSSRRAPCSTALAGELGVSERVELGVMIETPAAAVLADQLAQHADFFSVGSNDLTQYALCMDRVNPALAARVDGLHPAVLRCWRRRHRCCR